MSPEALRHFLRQRPFQPFRVVLADGRTFDVRYPEMNLLARTYVKIGVPESDRPDAICDHTVFVPLSSVARVEPLTAPSSPLAS